MTTVTFDTQELVNELKNNGFTAEQSNAVVEVIKKAQHDLATKRDLVDLKKDLIIWLGAIIFISFGLFSGLLAYIVK